MGPLCIFIIDEHSHSVFDTQVLVKWIYQTEVWSGLWVTLLYCLTRALLLWWMSISKHCIEYISHVYRVQIRSMAQKASVRLRMTLSHMTHHLVEKSYSSSHMLQVLTMEHQLKMVRFLKLSSTRDSCTDLFLCIRLTHVYCSCVCLCSGMSGSFLILKLTFVIYTRWVAWWLYMLFTVIDCLNSSLRSILSHW